jgi:pimeloyl-ACP methyl ester carboxylesterase
VSARRLGALATFAFLCLACASPIGVRRVGIETVQRELTANVLVTGKPSAYSTQELHLLDLYDLWHEDPRAALEKLYEFRLYQANARLFALAELSFVYANQTHDRSFYLASAVYAWAYLFPEDEAQRPNYFDPRTRLACDLYNLAITQGLKSEASDEVVLQSGTYALPFGELDVVVNRDGFDWGGYTLGNFAPAAEFEVYGFRNRYRRPGLGAPLSAALIPPKPGEGTVEKRIPPKLKVPVTALMRIAHARPALEGGKLSATLTLLPADESETAEVGKDEIAPLEAEISSSLAQSLTDAAVFKWEIGGFFSGLREMKLAENLLTLQPYHRGRIPLVLIHGTASSPIRWMELVNELYANPVLRQRYQVWLFTYDTGSPVLYSAAALRDSLRSALEDFDPEGRDPALRKMVLVGHSQGGLLAKLAVTSSGDVFWRNVSDKPFDQLKLAPATRAAVKRLAFFDPLPFVKTVIFIATPHRGSVLAGGRVQRWVSDLVDLPADFVKAVPEVTKAITRGSDAAAGEKLLHGNRSVDNMDPDSPFTRAYNTLAIAPGVDVHSIIAAQGEGPLQNLSDGVVSYESAHLDGVASELVVRSGHSTQSHPQTILEVGRILYENLDKP